MGKIAGTPISEMTPIIPTSTWLYDRYLDALRVLFAAAETAPLAVLFDGLRLPVRNDQIRQRLKAAYTVDQFNDLFSFCQSSSVFDLNVDADTGLVRTAGAEENWEMSGRQWVTDTVRCGDIERLLFPSSWKKALLTLARFYSQPEEIAAMSQAIENPDYYRGGALTDGVAHIFVPHSLQRDRSWFNNKRLESHGLALGALCRSVVEGISDHKEAGFSSDDLSSGQSAALLASTIANLASYLKAISTKPDTISSGSPDFDFAAPSAGPWEEIPFPGGLTWDIEAMRAGFEVLHTLMFDRTRADLAQFRKLILDSNHGAWLKNDGQLKALVANARAKVVHRLLGSAVPVEHPSRPHDAATAFISCSTIYLADNLADDVASHFKVLAVLENNLVRPNGMIRYAPFRLDGKELVFDSYLADNYWLVPRFRTLISGCSLRSHRDFGSTDCSSAEDFLLRAKTARPNTEAEWCWVSVMAEGYARQTARLLEYANREVQPDKALSPLIAHGLGKATEFINRAYARVTAPESVKTNARDCPAFAVPEAYECVSPIHDFSAKVMLPGANTPLAWAQASLYSASLAYAQVLKLAGQNNLSLSKT